MRRLILTVGRDGRVRDVIALPRTDSPWLWGYKDIGAHAGRNERWARRAANSGMPVSFIMGRPCITVERLESWLSSPA